MAADLYQKIALLARYPLAAAGACILGRAAWMTLRDGVKANRLRSGELKYGAVGVLTVLPADRRGKAQKYYVGRNGCVGGGRKSDVRIKGMGLRNRHFDYEIRRGVMYVNELVRGSVTRLGKKAQEDGAGPLTLAAGERILAGKAEIRFDMLKRPSASASPMSERVYKVKGEKK